MNFMSIIVYTKTNCFWCEELIDFLEGHNVDFEERNTRENIEYFEEMKKLSGQTLAPTVVIDGVVYADTDKDEIKRILNIE
jgi:glutaredoxin 3